MTETTTALVTGANKGIGREVAARLASLGTNVLLASRDPDRGAAAAADLGPRVYPVTLDVTDRASILSAAAGSRSALADWTSWSTTPASLATSPPRALAVPNCPLYARCSRPTCSA